MYEAKMGKGHKYYDILKTYKEMIEDGIELSDKQKEHKSLIEEESRILYNEAYFKDNPNSSLVNSISREEGSLPNEREKENALAQASSSDKSGSGALTRSDSGTGDVDMENTSTNSIANVEIKNKSLGKKSSVVTPKETDKEVSTQFAIVELSDLVTSDKNNYPTELQTRIRETKESQLDVNKIAMKLNPNLLGDSNISSEGSPIIQGNGVVISGNGRTMAINKVYKDNLPGKDKYKAYLKENSQDFGLTPEDINNFSEPVLVRILENNNNVEQFAIDSNISTVSSKSEIELAFEDAAQVDNSLLSKYDTTKDIDSSENTDFIRSFISKFIPSSQQTAYFST